MMPRMLPRPWQALPWCLALSGWLGMAALAHGQTTSNPVARAGTIKQVDGEAWILRNQTARLPAMPGDALAVADRLHTGPKGAISLVMRDGTGLTLGPDSAVHLDQFAYDTTTQQGNLLLELLQGSLRVVTGLLAKVNPDVFKVRTPTSVVGVRGTDFIIETEAAR